MRKKILWKTWLDPLLSIQEATPEHETEDTEEYKDSYHALDKMLSTGKPPERANTGPVLVGPMGVIPLQEHNIPSKVYNFWMGHTNFDITPEVKQTIESIPGVETLDVFTRYRFRIAIGKAFCNEEYGDYGRQVLQAITNQLCNPEKPKQERGKGNSKQLTQLKNHLKNKYAFWVILGKPDGTIETKGASTKEEVLDYIDNKKVIATSWE